MTWLLMSLCFVASFVSHILGTRGPYVARQSPLSMGVSRQEYWGGLPLPAPRDLPYSGIEPLSLHCRWVLFQLNHQGSFIMVRLTNSQLHIYFKMQFQKAWHWDFDWNCINFIQSFGKKLYSDNNKFPQQRHSLSLLLNGLSFMCFQ